MNSTAGYLTCPIPSQSARSRALARAVDRPTTLTLLEVWEEMKLVLDTMTSNTGPLSSPGNRHNGTVQSECLCNKQLCFSAFTLVWVFPYGKFGCGNISQIDSNMHKFVHACWIYFALLLTEASL